jgi:hypothetical protein
MKNNKPIIDFVKAKENFNIIEKWFSDNLKADLTKIRQFKEDDKVIQIVFKNWLVTIGHNYERSIRGILGGYTEDKNRDFMAFCNNIIRNRKINSIL